MKFSLFLSVMFLVTFNQAAAQEVTASLSLDQILAYCQEKWDSRTSAVAQCVTNLRLARAEATGVAIVARLEKGEERDEVIIESIEGLGREVDRLAAVQQHPATQLPAPTTVATALSTGVTYTRTGGVAWAPVAQPTVVSIHSLERMAYDTLHITNLGHSTARRTCGGEGAPLVVFYDHGVPVSSVFAPSGAPTGFLEVYWDRQNDGIPDGTVWALNLESQTDVWITWGLPNDLEIRYLRPGAQIAVEGLPLQTVYHPTTSNESSVGIGCGRDPNARRGGHQAIPAYSMSRVW